MNRTINCIRMLEILSQSKNPISREELAGLLETNIRNIIEYKMELELAGYYIKSVTGKYGGYLLESDNLVPGQPLTAEDIISIRNGVDFLRQSPDFVGIKEFNSAFYKLNLKGNKEDDNITYYSKFPIATKKEEIQDKINKFRKAVKEKRKVIIVDKDDAVCLIHPYKIFVYDGVWYVLAFEENPFNQQIILYYKISDIKEIQLKPQIFSIPYSFKESDYLDEFGMKKDRNWINLKLHISGKTTQTIKQRIYGRNQTIEDDQNNCLLSVEMPEEEVLSFILSLGSDCKVLHPFEVAVKVQEEIEKIKKNYN